MQKQAPSVGRILVMVGSRCPASACCSSCGWPSAARCRSSRRATASRSSFQEAGQLAQEADVRIRGVPRRQGQDDRQRQADGPLRRRRSSSSRSTRRCRTTRAPTCARRRCSGRPTSSSRPGDKTADNAIPDGGRLAAGQRRPDRRARRDLPRLRRQDAAARSRTGCRPRPSRSPAAAATSTTPSARSRPFAEDTSVLVKILNGQEPTVRGRRAQHGHGLLRPQRARRASCAAWSPTPTASSRRRPRANADARSRSSSALPTFEQRVARRRSTASRRSPSRRTR